MSTGPTTVAYYEDLDEACHAQALLVSAGLWCFLSNKSITPAGIVGILRLQVRPKDVPRARQLLAGIAA